MRENLKKTLKKNELSFGSWITLGHSSIPEIMAKAGFDWLVIDMEHSAINIQTAQDLIQIIDLKDMTPLVRLTQNDPGLIKRVMDAGAYGVIVPMVKTREDAIKAVKAVKYPPMGNRGVGLARAQGYGQTFEEYKKWVNKSSIVIVQIEHIDAVKNIKEIFSVKEIDGYIIGPYDLSASLGIPGELDDKKVLDAEKKVLNASKKYGKAAGIHVVPPDVDLTLEKINNDYKFIAVSVDFLFLGNFCIDTMKKIKDKL
jgi:2-keto-3-deoxy-L-rhamnonate aldolase RhmA